MSTPTRRAATNGDTRRVQTVVIGAGQTGLATAYYLTRAGQECLVVHENGRVGDQWRQRYDSLRLNTPAGRDGLPGMPFPAPPHSFPTGRQMGDYLEEYVRAHGIQVAHRARVQRVDRLSDGGYQVACSGMVVYADQVVVATGGEHHPRLPDIASRLDPGIRRDPFRPVPRPVAATARSGAGRRRLAVRRRPGAECAQAGHETWLSGTVKGEIPFDIESRRARLAVPVLFFIATHVLTERTPVGRAVRPRIRAGGTPLIRVKRRHLDAAGVHRVESRTTGAVDGRPRLADGTVLDVANVLWCTGFGQNFSFIHPPVVGEDGWPRDTGGVVPESPGLYFVGLLFQRGFYSMLIGGAGRDAKHIAKHILAADAKRAAPHPAVPAAA